MKTGDLLCTHPLVVFQVSQHNVSMVFTSSRSSNGRTVSGTRTRVLNTYQFTRSFIATTILTSYQRNSVYSLDQGTKFTLAWLQLTVSQGPPSCSADCDPPQQIRHNHFNGFINCYLAFQPNINIKNIRIVFFDTYLNFTQSYCFH